MLCFTRVAGEEVIIGDNIKVAIVSVKGKKVVLGVAAPRDVPVDRAEVRKVIDRDGRTRK
jgi:carbon storage regulator